MEPEVLKQEQDLQNILARAGNQTLLIFKRSATCPVSMGAEAEYYKFLQGKNNAEFIPAVVTVQEARPVSNDIAQRFGIKHESPQLLAVKDGQVLWHLSHSAITADEISKRL